MSTVALIPARGGSRGFPGKNLALLGGVSLLGHAVLLARRCAAVDRVVVSTDSAEIAAAARELGAEVPFLRPAALAGDETPMWPVVRHAVDALDEGVQTVVLLSPTAPFRLPEHVDAALATLAGRADADGVVAVVPASPNPLWVAVVDDGDGLMRHLWPEAEGFTRRQQLPEVLEVSGALYAWRRSFVREDAEHWAHGRHVLARLPRWTAVDVDEPWDLAVAEALLRAGVVALPWLPEAG